MNLDRYKSIKKIMGVFLLATLLSACQEDFLETKPSTSVSDADVFSSTETAHGVILGVYDDWKRSTIKETNKGTHNLAMVREAMALDVVIVKSHYLGETNYSAFAPTSARISHPWWAMYQAIGVANSILANLETMAGSDADKDELRGEALAIRGYSYFELIQTFQHTYILAKDMPGVPIYTPESATSAGEPRATVDGVYNQILSDLTTSLPIIGEGRRNKYYFNSDVVNALLAQVYLTMNNWSKAITHAQAARSNYPLMSSGEWVSGFKEYNGEWIWGQNNTENDVASAGAAAMMDPINGGLEAGWRVPDEYMALFSPTDIRGTLFSDDGFGNNSFSKYQNILSPSGTAKYPFIRSSEMYLIEAEASAKLGGKDTEAQDALFAVQSRADASAVKSTSTGQALVDEIILEKRKEFWGEGIYLRDMLRNQLPLDRGGSHNAKLSIPANSWQFIFPIPEKEILLNPNIALEDQNPTTGVL